MFGDGLTRIRSYPCDRLQTTRNDMFVRHSTTDVAGKLIIPLVARPASKRRCAGCLRDGGYERGWHAGSEHHPGDTRFPLSEGDVWEELRRRGPVAKTLLRMKSHNIIGGSPSGFR